MSLKSIKLETITSRLILILPLGICLLGCYFFAKWCFATVISTNTLDIEVAKFANDLAPSDPQTHYTLAVLKEKIFLADELANSLVEYEKATALGPNDFRTWAALSKSREQNGDVEGGLQALRKSIELAPNYSNLRWALGNYLLRHGKIDEGFVEMQTAAISNGIYKNQLIQIAWQFFDGNLEQVRLAVGNFPELNSSLAVFLAEKDLLNEAIGIWNNLPDEGKKSVFKQDGISLFNKLIQVKMYRSAVQIQSQISESSNEKFEVGKLFNGGFETDVNTEKAGPFEWQIPSGAEPQIGVDNVEKYSGNQSLVVVFNSQVGKEFRAISQIIAVEPGRKYVFEMFYKTQLKASTPLRWEIVDTLDGKILSKTSDLSSNADWVNLKTEFIANEKSQAVIVRFSREPCRTVICPITGRIWFDNFSIKGL